MESYFLIAALIIFCLAVYLYSNRENNDYAKVVETVNGVVADQATQSREFKLFKDEISPMTKKINDYVDSKTADKSPCPERPLLPSRIESKVTESGTHFVKLKLVEPVPVQIIPVPPLRTVEPPPLPTTRKKRVTKKKIGRPPGSKKKAGKKKRVTRKKVAK